MFATCCLKLNQTVAITVWSTTVNVLLYIYQATAMCYNLLMQIFTGKGKNLRILHRLTLKHVMLLQKYKEKQFFLDSTF
jgi:hypothetical protein